MPLKLGSKGYIAMQFRGLLKGVLEKRDGLARRKDVVGKWEIED